MASNEVSANGVPYDHAELDAVERRFWRGIWGAIPVELAAERGISTRSFGPVQATIVTALPEVRMLNLILGGGSEGAVARGHLSDAIEWIETSGVSAYVPLNGGNTEAKAAEQLLATQGYESGYAWMKFVRDTHPPRFAESPGVEIRQVRSESEPFGMIAATGFGLPAWAAAFFADLHQQPGWHCYLARVDGEPAACAAMFIHEGIAEFGIAATLEAARGRGCQMALLRRRIADAASAGCRLLFLETGEGIPDHSSASYRNILRAGFEEAYLRPNWQRPSGQEAPTGIEPV